MTDATDQVVEKIETSKEPGFIKETVSVVIQALFLAVIVRTLIVQPFSIPSGSMKSTLLVGDYLFVNKISYGYSRFSMPFAPNLFEGRIWEGKPERGDIAVFRLPSNENIDYIKRVIGLPGDKIQVINSVLHINGTAVPRVADGIYVPEDGDAAGVEVPVFTETLPNGVTYQTLDVYKNAVGDNTPVFEVPDGHYFMMGDNRDNSLDSRFDVGFVPLDNFIGPASVVFFSVRNESHPLAFWKWPTDMRFSRIFKGL